MHDTECLQTQETVTGILISFICHSIASETNPQFPRVVSSQRFCLSGNVDPRYKGCKLYTNHQSSNTILSFDSPLLSPFTPHFHLTPSSPPLPLSHLRRPYASVFLPLPIGVQLTAEGCFYVEVSRELTVTETGQLQWLLSDACGAAVGPASGLVLDGAVEVEVSRNSAIRPHARTRTPARPCARVCVRACVYVVDIHNYSFCCFLSPLFFFNTSEVYYFYPTRTVAASQDSHSGFSFFFSS